MKYYNDDDIIRSSFVKFLCEHLLSTEHNNDDRITEGGRQGLNVLITGRDVIGRRRNLKIKGEFIWTGNMILFCVASILLEDRVY